MADDIPADWYPDAHGTIRWWDGTQWTTYVRGPGSSSAPPVVPEPQAPVEPEPQAHLEPAALPAAEPAVQAPVPSVGETAVLSTIGSTAATPATPAPATPLSTSAPMSAEMPVDRPTVTYPRPAPSAPSTVTSRVIYPVNPEADEEEPDEDHSATRRIVLTATAVGLAALFLGMGIGGRNQAPQALPSPEPTPVVITDSPELDQREADLDDREEQLDDREAELNKRQTDLDTRKAELDRRALETPTPTATATATATRIDGEATVLVGTDVRSGTYRTSGPSDPEIECEYTISRDSGASDVIDEGQTNGTATVSLRDGEYFDSDDCEEWVRE